MQHHKYSLTELENMMPWEREIYLGLLQKYIKERNEEIEKCILKFNLNAMSLFSTVKAFPE